MERIGLFYVRFIDDILLIGPPSVVCEGRRVGNFTLRPSNIWIQTGARVPATQILITASHDQPIFSLPDVRVFLFAIPILILNP